MRIQYTANQYGVSSILPTWMMLSKVEMFGSLSITTTLSTAAAPDKSSSPLLSVSVAFLLQWCKWFTTIHRNLTTQQNSKYGALESNSTSSKLPDVW